MLQSILKLNDENDPDSGMNGGEKETSGRNPPEGDGPSCNKIHTFEVELPLINGGVSDVGASEREDIWRCLKKRLPFRSSHVSPFVWF
jgi:hypothetical protein